jgi:hypothetical protein
VSTAEVSDIGGVPEGTVGAGMAGGGTSRSKVPGGVATAPESSCTTSPGLPGPFLPGSSDCTSPSINWKQVDSEAQLACSRVADAEWLLSTCYSELVFFASGEIYGFCSAFRCIQDAKRRRIIFHVQVGLVRFP